LKKDYNAIYAQIENPEPDQPPPLDAVPQPAPKIPEEDIPF
jgi:hypothetical protein